MANEIHIERISPSGQRVPIRLEEWQTAVESVPDVRLANNDASATNPKTGEVITVHNPGGDAEVFFPDISTWTRVFAWKSTGRISFRSPQDWDNPTSHVRETAKALARRLNARLVGDEGEIYEDSKARQNEHSFGRFLLMVLAGLLVLVPVGATFQYPVFGVVWWSIIAAVLIADYRRS